MPDTEARRNCNFPSGIQVAVAVDKHVRTGAGTRRRSRGFIIELGNTRFDFVRRQESRFQEQRFQSAQPASVIAVSEVADGVDPLNGMTKLIAASVSFAAQIEHHAKHRTVPAFQKSHGVVCWRHRPETTFTAEIVN